MLPPIIPLSAAPVTSQQDPVKQTPPIPPVVPAQPSSSDGTIDLRHQRDPQEQALLLREEQRRQQQQRQQKGQDEPFSAVDLPTRLRLQDLAARLLAGRTVLMVTHDPLEALRLSHRILVLTGQPARLAEASAPAAPPPRSPQDPALLAEQGQLLARLKEAAS